MISPAPHNQVLQQILAELKTTVSGFDPRNVTTSLAILRFANRCLSSYEAHFARYGLSQGRFTTLMFLYHLPTQSWTPAALAKASAVRRATMTGLLDVLERAKWIARAPNPKDGRSNEISLTANGRARLKKILPDHFARLGAAMQGLSAREHRTLITLMDKFGANVASLATAGNSTNEKER